MHREVWRNRHFRRLWLGTLAVRLGVQVGIIALTWLVLKTTGSGTKIGLVLALYAAGDMLASPWVGVLLDRVPRKLMLNLDNVLQAGIFVALAVLYVAHQLPLGLLIALAVVSGGLSPLAYLGRMIVLPNVVEAGEWESANTLMQINMNVVTLLGPALGGVLVAALGVPWTLMLTSGAYLVYFVALWGIPRDRFRAESQDHVAGTFLRDMVSGWTFLRRVPLLLVLVVVTLLFSLTYGPLEPALPVLVHSVFHGGPRVLGALWSSFAVGALVGTLAWGRLRPSWPLRIVVSTIIMSWGLFSGAIGLTRHAWVAAVLLALGGLTYAPYNILFSLWRQRLVPDSLRGRVFGAINGITGLGLPLGQALGGFLIGAMGSRATVTVGGIACIVVGVGAMARASLWRGSEDSAGTDAAQSIGG